MSDFAALLAELDALDGCPRTKRRVRELLGRYAGRRLFVSRFDLRAAERRDALRQLLSTSPRDGLARLIVERWGVSPRTARYWVQHAARDV
jgi:hypothetical protein